MRLKTTPGVYRIRCKKNGWAYIGASWVIEARWYKHLSDLQNMKHYSPRFQSDWLRYGPDAFSWTILHVDTANPFKKEAAYARSYAPKLYSGHAQLRNDLI